MDIFTNVSDLRTPQPPFFLLPTAISWFRANARGEVTGVNGSSNPPSLLSAALLAENMQPYVKFHYTDLVVDYIATKRILGFGRVVNDITLLIGSEWLRFHYTLEREAELEFDRLTRHIAHGIQYIHNVSLVDAPGTVHYVYTNIVEGEEDENPPVDEMPTPATVKVRPREGGDDDARNVTPRIRVITPPIRGTVPRVTRVPWSAQ